MKCRIVFLLSYFAFKKKILNKKFTYILFVTQVFFSICIQAQEEPIRAIGDRMQRFGGIRRTIGQGSTDSLRKRDKFADSITISFRLPDSTKSYRLDSSVTDFSKRFPVPVTDIYLGNLGTAARSLLFSPVFEPGFDPGFHGFDVYKWKLENARYFQTTRPYSELNYFLGSRTEQIIELLHTQNRKPNWNILFQYRLINSPGFFKKQKTNHNNYLITSKFQSKNLRYNNYFTLVGNKLIASENGGLQDTADFLNLSFYKDRFTIPTKLGRDEEFSSNFFSTNVSTGNKYSLFTVYLRQQYDLGRKDSLVSDSTVIPLFFPRLRFEHTFQLDQNKYTYHDYFADSMYYKVTYDTNLNKPLDSLIVKERWQVLSNDFSIYQFPDAQNLHQFIKAGLQFQHITGELSSGRKTFINTAGHFEYRNKTRNQVWDMEAKGQLYFTGFNRGDYHALISLERLLGKRLGYLQLGFENSNRTPSFVFDNRSSFYFMKTAVNLKKENNTHLFASYFLPSFKLKLSGDYFILTNYTYLKNYYEVEQENTLFNFLRISLQKTIKLGKRWNWHTEIYIQQAIGDAPVHTPWLYTRNRIAYEGNFGFKNLHIATGLEIKYRAAYKADGYSPVLGRFYYQDTITIRNPLPDIAAYINFRIKPFKAFIRAENLNTARNLDGFGFTNNNLVAPGYALPGLQFRLGVWWGFVN